MKTIITFFLCMGITFALKAQHKFKILYHELGYTTASGVPLIFADKSDTSRKEIISQCVNLIQSDSIAHIFYESSGKCRELYPDSTTVFGKNANHHDIFFHLGHNTGYEYRLRGLQKSRLQQFSREDAQIVITKRNIIISGMKCSEGYIQTAQGVVNVVFTDDERYPGKSFYRGFVFPGLLVEMYWSSTNIYAKMVRIEKGDFFVEIPDLKIIQSKSRQ